MLQQVFFIIVAIVVLSVVLTQVRNQKMKEKYAFLWSSVSVVVIVLAAFPHILSAFAGMFGIVTPVNLLFLLAILVLIWVSIHLSLELSRSAEDTRKLAEEVAILRAVVEQGVQHKTLNRSGFKTVKTEILQNTKVSIVQENNDH